MGQPSTQTMSLIVVGMPSTADFGDPLRHRVSESRAAAMAKGRSMRVKALQRDWMASARSSAAVATSTGDKRPLA